MWLLVQLDNEKKPSLLKNWYTVKKICVYFLQSNKNLTRTFGNDFVLSSKEETYHVKIT